MNSESREVLTKRDVGFALRDAFRKEFYSAALIMFVLAAICFGISGNIDGVLKTVLGFGVGAVNAITMIIEFIPIAYFIYRVCRIMPKIWLPTVINSRW